MKNIKSITGFFRGKIIFHIIYWCTTWLSSKTAAMGMLPCSSQRTDLSSRTGRMAYTHVIMGLQLILYLVDIVVDLVVLKFTSSSCRSP